MLERELLEKETLFTSWVKDHSDRLYSWAFYKVSDKESAEDLVQETFLSAFKHFNTFKGKSSPLTWLTAILNNKIIDHYKKRAKQEIVVDIEQSGEMYLFTETLFDTNGKWSETAKKMNWSNESHLLDDEDFTQVLELCMNDLPENWRKAVSFKYLLEKDAKDICQELDISMSNYWQVIHRAKLLLKQCLEVNYFKSMS